jgi:hypothetical protein
MRVYRYAPWALLILLAVFGCGTPVCVGPFAISQNCYDQEADGAATSGALTFVMHPTTINPSQTITFVVQGGIAPYSFRRPSPDKGTMTSSGVYTAPSDESGFSIIVEAEDSVRQSVVTTLGVVAP